MRNKSSDQITQDNDREEIRLSVKERTNTFFTKKEQYINIEDSTPKSNTSNYNRFMKLTQSMKSKRKSYGSLQKIKSSSKLSKTSKKISNFEDLVQKKAKSKRLDVRNMPLLANSKAFKKRSIGSKSNVDLADMTNTDSEKRKKLYQRIEKLKLDVASKKMIRMENQSLKDMQKLLMKRLEQQDEYFNQCMFGKQQEVDQLSKKLRASQDEVLNL
jgi:hypothetical protein